jgi:hypothetical protein
MRSGVSVVTIRSTVPPASGKRGVDGIAVKEGVDISPNPPDPDSREAER